MKIAKGFNYGAFPTEAISGISTPYLPFIGEDSVRGGLLLYPSPPARPIGRARRNRVEETTVLEINIGTSERLRRISIIREGGFGFEEAAVDKQAGSISSAAIMEGRPVAVWMRFTVNSSCGRYIRPPEGEAVLFYLTVLRNDLMLLNRRNE